MKATAKPDELRSRTMRAVKGKNTKPEMIVRRLVHHMGYRYGLHRSDLPGKPDLAFTSRKKLLFVNGCFWHGHPCRRGARRPKENAAYWGQKIDRNKKRDHRNLRELRRLGWNVLTVWECQINDPEVLKRRIIKFLEQS